ncbi:copper-containing amine oxidase [Sugiyamaella lignohabitans]|uniref:Amine oxidase n=1 Tax=Sugiyamaella lignohabitans TaxID=796027 RepID=A0A167FHW0_9ASCO|nr:copper-containing amine oxidase [Sugiyamaella lignohabitans]ANB15316.1 copper-containing amine oxidase [Sugiyamaella lignohabitans]
MTISNIPSSVKTPFDPITAEEITVASSFLKKKLSPLVVQFRVIDVDEPRKAQVIEYLEKKKLNKDAPLPTRYVKLIYVKSDSPHLQKSIYNVDTGSIESTVEFPLGVKSSVDLDAMPVLEELCLTHPKTLEEIKLLQIPDGYTVVTDPWIYGTDDSTETRSLIQFYMYIRKGEHPEANHYSIPLKFSPVFDSDSLEFVRMDYLPSGIDSSTDKARLPWTVVEPIEYSHDLHKDGVRDGLKPLVVSQPEGASFEVNGTEITWQGWSLNVGFTVREGPVLYNLSFKGRSIMYRLSFSELTVPYGDPRAPYHRKQAFDLGDVGYGASANSLKLGCDCLGHIKYLSSYRSSNKGEPILLDSVVCIHEQDSGLLFKHTNFRNGAATLSRRRQLVIQSIATLANYEYIIAFILNQAGEIEVEIRATGILSTMPIDYGSKVPWGTTLGPGLFAANHQHLFSFRIDPAVDGFNNTISYEETFPMKRDPVDNPFGVGFGAKRTIVQNSGHFELDPTKNRTFKISNESIKNKVTGNPVAYKLLAPSSQMMLMDDESFNVKRAVYAKHPIWVTKYKDGELYAAGEFTNQSQEETGLGKWTARDDSLDKNDPVLWYTFGLTHNPRPEDFPIMPVEGASFMLIPSGFFNKNPALDVPPSLQTLNKSTLADETACHMDKLSL